jgi:hypothetical protein
MPSYLLVRIRGAHTSEEGIAMRRTEILAAAAAAAHRFRKMLGSAVVDRQVEEISRHDRTLDESTSLLLALELLKLSEDAAQELDAVFRNAIHPYSAKCKEAETDLFWLGHHLLHREISAIHEPALRDEFMDFLMKQLCLITTYEIHGAEAWEIGQGLLARASATHEDYSRFHKVYPDEDKPAVRTLLWEFTKGVAVNYRGDYRDRTTLDVFGIVLAYSEDVCNLLATAH